MFAVVKTGGKQYKVAVDDVVTVEKLEVRPGDRVQFDQVLMLGGDSPVIGAPVVDGAAVVAEVVEQVKAPKVISFVKRRRKHSSKRKRGHRQPLTTVKITEILPSGAATSAPVAAED